MRAMELDRAPLPNPPPPFVVRAALALRSRLRALLDAAGPPELALYDRVTGAAATMLVGTVARLGIPDLLARGARTAEQIAEELALDPDATFRVMRGLAASGVFARRDDGRFENNRVSEALRSGTVSRARDFAIYFASASNVRAWMALEHTMRTGKNGFQHANDGKHVWQWFDEHEDERETFAQAMMGITTLAAPQIASLYPFSEVKAVCDVGGGRGTLLSELLIRHPHLMGTLCDAPGVLESGRSLLRARGVIDRVTLAPGSFFDAVPRGSDAYVLKNILHDWDDARSIEILRVIRRSTERGAKVLVCEALVERDGADVLGAFSDLQMMMVCCEGRERGRGDFARLFETAGFTPGRVFEGATIAVLEATAS